jgi:hypothetical protein
MSGGGARAQGRLYRLRPKLGQEDAVAAHLSAWHRTAGRVLPGTRLHLLLSEPGSGDMTIVHVFESQAAAERVAASSEQHEWEQKLNALLEAPPETREVVVGWNAATEARPRVSVSIDRDVHATVEDLISRLLARHPRTPGEDAYLAMLQSISEDYQREFPATAPEEGEPR